MTGETEHGIKAAQTGVIVNAALAATKLAAGILGNTYALIADAVESFADIFASLIVWGGLHIASQPADDDHPFGHGKAEALATAVVAIMLLGAAIAITVEASHEIRVPHRAPAPWTLIVLIVVVAVKWTLSQRVRNVSAITGSRAVHAESVHHFSDAVTSAAAFIGISVAIVGGKWGTSVRWAAADDWAAIVAACVIAYNGVEILRHAVDDLMDRGPDAAVIRAIDAAARGVPEVLFTEQITARKSGTAWWITLHAQAAPDLSLHDAHIVSGKVKGAVRTALPNVASVLVHMEPYEPASRSD